MTVPWFLLATAHAGPNPVSPHPVTAEVAEQRALHTLPASRAMAERSLRPFGPAQRPVWPVHLNAIPGYAAPVALIDAASGALVALEDDALHARAWVYPDNPVVSDEPIEVELPAAADMALSDARMEVFQCRDLGDVNEVEDSSGALWYLHVCTEVLAEGPVDGDYLHPAEPYPSRPARSEDSFVAAHLYWNVHQGLDWFEARGWVPDEDYDARVDVVANFRITNMHTKDTAADVSYPLGTYDNAYAQGGWFNNDGEWRSPRLVFGQGRTVDYGYDSDVVHHELGHMIVSSIGSLSRFSSDKFGASARARALNEGYADYFSSAIQADPQLGEYASDGRKQIRHLVGDANCRDDLFGESHRDSRPFSQALWFVRQQLSDAEQAVMDATVLQSIPAVSEDPGFDTAFEVLPHLLDQALGVEVGDALREQWRWRSFDDCKPIVRVVPGPEPFRTYTQLPRWNQFSTERHMPGYVQFRVDIPEPGTTVVFRAEQNESLDLDLYGSFEPQPLSVYGISGEQLTWDREDVVSEVSFDGGAPFPVDVTRWTPRGEYLGELSRVDTRPRRYSPERVLAHTYEIRFVVDREGPFIFQFANEHARAATLLDLEVTLISANTEDPPAAFARDLEPIACGCASTTPSFWGLFVLVLAMVRRRRRTSARR